MTSAAELEIENKKLKDEIERFKQSVNGSRSTWTATEGSGRLLGDAFGTLTGGVKGAINGIGEIAKQAQELKNNWQEASRMGLGLGKDMFTFKASLLEAGLTFDEYKKATQNLTAGVSGLGAGMNASMKSYLTSVQDFKGSNLGDQARRFGTDFAEMADLVAISTDRRIKQDRLVDGKNTELTQRTSDLAVAVAANTEVFGISRTVQMEALKKQQEDALVQQQMTAKQKQQYDLMFGSLEALGLGKYGNLAVKQQGRFTSDQQVEMMSAMGAGNAREFQAAIKESLAAAESGDKPGGKARIEAANQRMMQIQEEIIRYSQSDSVKNRVAITQFMDGSGSLVKGLEKTADISQKSAGIYERMSNGLTLEQAIAQAKADLAKAPEPAKTPGKEGELATDAVLKMERAVRDIGRDTGLAIITGAQKTGEILSGALKPYYEKIANTNMRDTTGAKNFSSAHSGFSPRFVRETLEEIKNGTITSSGEFIVTKFKEAIDSLMKELPGREYGSPGIPNFLSNTGGDFKNMFEDWGAGTTTILHGQEAVFRPEQLAGVINKVQGSTQGLLSNVQSQFTPEKITNLINTAVSSASSSLPNATTVAANGQIQLSNSTLDEIKAQLTTLNTIMDSHLRALNSTSDKQYSALKSLSPDLHS